MKQRTLYIPGHVTTENVVWQGLLVRDAVKVIILTVIAAVIAFLIGVVFSINQLYLILAVVVAAACGVGVLQRFETNLSMADYIRAMLKFTKEQKHFYYVFRR